MRFRAVKELNGWLTDWKPGSRLSELDAGRNGSTATRHTLGQGKAPGAARGAEGMAAAEERWGPGTVRGTESHEGASPVRPSVSANGVNLRIGCALSEGPWVWRLPGHRAPMTMTNGARNEGRGCGLDGPPSGRSAPCHRVVGSLGPHCPAIALRGVGLALPRNSRTFGGGRNIKLRLKS